MFTVDVKQQHNNMLYVNGLAPYMDDNRPELFPQTFVPPTDANFLMKDDSDWPSAFSTKGLNI